MNYTAPIHTCIWENQRCKVCGLPQVMAPVPRPLVTPTDLANAESRIVSEVRGAMFAILVAIMASYILVSWVIDSLLSPLLK